MVLRLGKGPALLGGMHDTQRGARALAMLFFSGGVLGTGSLMLPHWHDLNTGLMVLLASAGFIVGPFLWWTRTHITRVLLHVLLATGTVLVSFGVAFSGNEAASATYGLFYVWVAMYAFHIFRWRAGLAHVAIVAACYGTALMAASYQAIAAQWLLTVGIVAVNGLVVGWLADRLQDSYHQFYEGEQALVRRLEEAEQLKEELVANVSHDLRSPLTAIMGFTRVLRAHGEDLDAAEKDHFLERVEKQTERLGRLIDNLLLAAGFSEPDPRATTDVRTVLEEVLAGVASRGSGKVPDVQIAGMGGIVRMGAAALHQVLAEVLTAVLAHAEAQVCVVLAESPHGVRITVMAQAAAEPHPGRPLSSGLPVVRRLVDLHGGTLGAEVDGLGLSVILELPAVSAGEAALA